MLRPAWWLAFLDRSDQTLGVGRRRRLRPSFPQRRSLASRVGYDYPASLERYGDRTFTGWIVAVTGCARHRPSVQIERILRINELSVMTEDVVEAARSTLAIGAT